MTFLTSNIIPWEMNVQKGTCTVLYMHRSVLAVTMNALAVTMNALHHHDIYHFLPYAIELYSILKNQSLTHTIFFYKKKHKADSFHISGLIQTVKIVIQNWYHHGNILSLKPHHHLYLSLKPRFPISDIVLQLWRKTKLHARQIQEQKACV